jgi:hypothetical protein
MSNDTYLILAPALFPTFAALAFIFSLVAYVQVERARRQTTRRLQDIQVEIAYLIEEVLAVSNLTTRTLAHARVREHRQYEIDECSNTPLMRHSIATRIPRPLPRHKVTRQNTDLHSNYPRLIPSRTSPTSPNIPPPPTHALSYAAELHLLTYAHLALHTFIRPPLPAHQINHIVLDFGNSIQNVFQQGSYTNGLDHSLVPRIASAFLNALTRATSVEPAQLERIIKWMRVVLRGMAVEMEEVDRDGDGDSMRVNRSSTESCASSSGSPTPSGSSRSMAISLSGDTLVGSDE